MEPSISNGIIHVTNIVTNIIPAQPAQETTWMRALDFVLRNIQLLLIIGVAVLLWRLLKKERGNLSNAVSDEKIGEEFNGLLCDAIVKMTADARGLGSPEILKAKIGKIFAAKKCAEPSALPDNFLHIEYTVEKLRLGVAALSVNVLVRNGRDIDKYTMDCEIERHLLPEPIASELLKKGESRKVVYGDPETKSA
ncbi:MAG: hypothetical protein FWG05_00625 [Kiritimatiellaeota bacterium]|nr:hypothetical protein [Kiritimatiellota bacterium]